MSSLIDKKTAPLDKSYLDGLTLKAIFEKYVSLDQDTLECGHHAIHVQIITEILLHNLSTITNKYKLSNKDIHYISIAASLHDIGKAYVAGDLVTNTDELTKEEYDLIKTHTMVGSAMLDYAIEIKDPMLLKYAKDVCRWHHERWDGNGYPDKLVEEQIPIAAQIVAIADCYVALTTDRSYQTHISHNAALVKIISGQCGQFNPVLLECLIASSEEIRLIHETKLNKQLSKEEIVKILGELSDKLDSFLE